MRLIACIGRLLRHVVTSHAFFALMHANNLFKMNYDLHCMDENLLIFSIQSSFLPTIRIFKVIEPFSHRATPSLNYITLVGLGSKKRV